MLTFGGAISGAKEDSGSMCLLLTVSDQCTFGVELGIYGEQMILGGVGMYLTDLEPMG